jgi:hypothetical protein
MLFQQFMKLCAAKTYVRRGRFHEKIRGRATPRYCAQQLHTFCTEFPQAAPAAKPRRQAVPVSGRS